MAQNLVFEYCKDNIEDLIQAKRNNEEFFSMDEIKEMMQQILKGLVFIHERNIVHRDLKPENILVNDQGVVKICDFGSAKVIDPSGKNTPYIVSRYYRAPELILGVSKYGPPIDIWAVGCIFAELITQRPLFPGKSEGSQLLEQVAILGSIKDSDIDGMTEGKGLPESTMKIIKDIEQMRKKKIYDKFPSRRYEKVSKLTFREKLKRLQT